MCKYIVYDMINQMIINNVIEYFLIKYLNSVGCEILTKIIDKIIKIIFFTFIELSYL